MKHGNDEMEEHKIQEVKEEIGKRFNFFELINTIYNTILEKVVQSCTTKLEIIQQTTNILFKVFELFKKKQILKILTIFYLDGGSTYLILERIYSFPKSTTQYAIQFLLKCKLIRWQKFDHPHGSGKSFRIFFLKESRDTFERIYALHLDLVQERFIDQRRDTTKVVYWSDFIKEKINTEGFEALEKAIPILLDAKYVGQLTMYQALDMAKNQGTLDELGHKKLVKVVKLEDFK